MMFSRTRHVTGDDSATSLQVTALELRGRRRIDHVVPTEHVADGG
jgi:hypothetical protein